MDQLGYDVRDVIVGAPKINIRPLNVASMPPNVWFSPATSVAPAPPGKDGMVVMSWMWLND